MLFRSKTFTATVRQVRLQPETVSNVVSYTVVLDAENREGLLLPGMTATVDFVVEERKDVLLVPSAALRIKPTEEMFAEARGSMERPEAGGAGEQAHGRERSGSQTSPDGRTAAGGQQSAGGQQRSAGHGAWGGMGGQNGQSSDRALVWYLNENGKLAFAPVKKGATDGKNTEILEGPVKEGMQVIVSLSPSASSSSERTNPLTPSFPGRRR